VGSSSPTSRKSSSPTGHMTADMMQALNSKRQVIEKIAPNTCSTATKWKLYQQITAETSKTAFRSASQSQRYGNGLGHGDDRMAKRGQHVRSSAADRADNASYLNKRIVVTPPLGQSESNEFKTSGDKQEAEGPVKLSAQLFPLSKRSTSRRVVQSTHAFRQTRNKSWLLQNSNSSLKCGGLMDYKDRPTFDQLHARLDSQGMSREKGDPLQLGAARDILSNARSH